MRQQKIRSDDSSTIKPSRIGAARALSAPILGSGSRGDGLRLLWSGVEIPFMRVVGTTPGVIVLGAAGRNGLGVGRLRARGVGLSWQAPSSAAEGSRRACNFDGVWLLEDGEDSSKWIKVQVYTDFLAENIDAAVYIADTYNKLGPSDITAAQNTSGVNDVTIYTLQNVSGNAIVSAKLWIEQTISGYDDSSNGITVSQDGVNYFSPTSSADVNALYWASIAVGSGVSVWVKRQIAGHMINNPKIINALGFSWIGY